jgi:hypothetical protein
VNVLVKILARDRRRFNPIALTNIHVSSPLRKAIGVSVDAVSHVRVSQ